MTSLTHRVRVLGGVLGLVLIVSAGLATPNKAHAVWGFEDIVFDPGALVQALVDWAIQEVQQALSDQIVRKEFIFDSFARIAGNVAVQEMSQSIANIAATGSDGEPLFETNLPNSFLRIGDTVATDLLEQIQAGGEIESPFSVDVGQGIINNYFRRTGEGAFQRTAAYTLGDTCENHEAFIAGDFGACGFTGFVSLFGNSANNPLGLGALIESELTEQISEARSTYTRQLDWGEGFRPTTAAPEEGTGEETAAAEGEGTTETTGTTEVSGEPAATETETATDVNLTQTLETTADTTSPSSLVHDTVQGWLIDAGVDLNTNVDEINELFVTWVSSMIQDELFGDEGLAGGASYSRGETPAPTGATVNALRISLQTHTPKLGPFIENWQTILAKAQEAKTRAASCSGENAQKVVERIVQPVIDQAEEAIERAERAVATLGELTVRLQSAEEDGEEFNAIFEEYQALEQSGDIPSVHEYIYATENAADIGPPAVEEESLYRKMKNIAGASCTQINLMSVPGD